MHPHWKAVCINPVFGVFKHFPEIGYTYRTGMYLFNVPYTSVSKHLGNTLLRCSVSHFRWQKQRSLMYFSRRCLCWWRAMTRPSWTVMSFLFLWQPKSWASPWAKCELSHKLRSSESYIAYFILPDNIGVGLFKTWLQSITGKTCNYVKT